MCLVFELLLNGHVIVALIIYCYSRKLCTWLIGDDITLIIDVSKFFSLESRLWATMVRKLQSSLSVFAFYLFIDNKGDPKPTRFTASRKSVKGRNVYCMQSYPYFVKRLFLRLERVTFRSQINNFFVGLELTLICSPSVWKIYTGILCKRTWLME